jgi:hypothetical protein
MIIDEVRNESGADMNKDIGKIPDLPDLQINSSEGSSFTFASILSHDLPPNPSPLISLSFGIKGDKKGSDPDVRTQQGGPHTPNKESGLGVADLRDIKESQDYRYLRELNFIKSLDAVRKSFELSKATSQGQLLKEIIDKLPPFAPPKIDPEEECRKYLRSSALVGQWAESNMALPLTLRSAVCSWAHYCIGPRPPKAVLEKHKKELIGTAVEYAIPVEEE